MNRTSRFASWCIGFSLLIFFWELAGRENWLGSAWPSLSALFAFMQDPSSAALLLRSSADTASNATIGFLLGSLVGFTLACSGSVWTGLGPGLATFATFVNATPLIALGQLLIVTVGEEVTPAATAGLAVFFSVFIATLSGLQDTNRDQSDVLSIYGSGKIRALICVRIPNAMPKVMDGLKLGTTAAVLGAIIGEWFGAPTGLGVILVSAMQNFQIELLWASALCGTVLSGLSFFLLAAIQTQFIKRLV